MIKHCGLYRTGRNDSYIMSWLQLERVKLESHSHDMVLGPARTCHDMEFRSNHSFNSSPHRGSVLGDVLATSALS